MIELEKMKQDYMANIKTLTSEQRTAQQNAIDAKFDKCKEISDEKVQLANQTYEMVDKHIRRLDADLAKFESELRDRALSGGNVDDSEIKPSTSGKFSSSLTDSNTKLTKGRKKRKNSTMSEELHHMIPINSLALSLAQPADVLDMEIDPNEPTYCVCRQVSYGEMIGCDNPDCPIEWFHFNCVQLTSKPKGKWYCPQCTEERKKKNDK